MSTCTVPQQQPPSTCHTVDTLPACLSAMAQLEREGVIAVDTEGVMLSRTGPITLLQVATPAATVFLFDVFSEPRMFQDGGLKRLLENEAIMKVMHSASNDAEALWWQHQVELRNVHDTQMAHRELQRSQGRLFPPRTRLSDVCSEYCPQKALLMGDVKDIVRTKMNRTDGEYWATRPLTQEMISYAASDVIALIPEVYTTQKQLLEDKGLTQTFRSRVELELQGVKDPDVLKPVQEKERAMAASTLREFVAASPGTWQFQDITDDNVLEALSIVRLDKVSKLGLPPHIQELKIQQIQARLDSIEHEMEQQGKDYNGHSVCRKVNAFVSILRCDPALKQRAQGVLMRVNQLILDDIKEKYTPRTPLAHIADYERKVLTRLVRPEGERDPDVHPVLLGLYWRLRLAQLEEVTRDFKADPEHYEVWDSYVEILRSYVSGDVPAALKEGGKELLDLLEKMGR